jgi:hypothetical protein
MISIIDVCLELWVTSTISRPSNNNSNEPYPLSRYEAADYGFDCPIRPGDYHLVRTVKLAGEDDLPPGELNPLVESRIKKRQSSFVVI